MIKSLYGYRIELKEAIPVAENPDVAFLAVVDFAYASADNFSNRSLLNAVDLKNARSMELQ